MIVLHIVIHRYFQGTDIDIFMDPATNINKSIKIKIQPSITIYKLYNISAIIAKGKILKIQTAMTQLIHKCQKSQWAFLIKTLSKFFVCYMKGKENRT